MAICSSVQNIAASECIGDSLVKINNNFLNLNTDTCTLLTLVNTLSAQVAALAGSQAVPVGAIQAFAMATAPTGWLECNGVAVPNGSGTVQGQTANFASLYSVIGTTYGAVGTLPDLRGYFIRGSGTNSDGSASGTFGQKQADAFKSHTHIFAATRSVPSDSVRGRAEIPLMENSTPNSYNYGMGLQVTGDTETRPKNIALLYCIKY